MKARMFGLGGLLALLAPAWIIGGCGEENPPAATRTFPDASAADGTAPRDGSGVDAPSDGEADHASGEAGDTGVDGADASTPPGPRRVFVTSTTYDGNLGSLAGANLK